MKLLMSTKSIANAVGGKTARACDSCVRKRARWYCAADDAFLCQSCDSTVHSANPLARRHQRLRLNSSTSSNPPDNSPSWVSGFTRKPRSRRPRRKSESDEVGLSSLVPEADEDNNEDQELLLYRVPTFDPFVVEENQSKSSVVGESSANNLHGSSFLPSDLDLADFAADVESLLGRNLESECFDMEGLGLGRVVKLEEEQQRRHTHTNHNSCRHVPVQQFEAGLDPFQFNFEDYEHDQKLTVVGVKNERQHQDSSTAAAADQDNNRKVLLRLDCDAVIAAWANHKSPWTTGERPDFDPDQSWPHSMAICGSVRYGQTCGEYGVSTAAVGDGGREARVSRYREKRRTRLFSKKIRYEVRKLNAEKRPRMKGRFVKRTSSFTLPIISIN